MCHTVAAAMCNMCSYVHFRRMYTSHVQLLHMAANSVAHGCKHCCTWLLTVLHMAVIHDVLDVAMLDFNVGPDAHALDKCKVKASQWWLTYSL